MVAVNELRPTSFRRNSLIANSASPFALLKGSLFARKVARQSPMVSGLHRAVDGALIGILMAVAMMSGFTLHWRYLWTNAFTHLETTRELSHNLTESTALLERHMLQRSRLPLSMVHTKAANLLYLDSPEEDDRRMNNDVSLKVFLKKSFAYHPVNHGY